VRRALARTCHECVGIGCVCNSRCDVRICTRPLRPSAHNVYPCLLVHRPCAHVPAAAVDYWTRRVRRATASSTPIDQR
jgi:hypothetical protein